MNHTWRARVCWEGRRGRYVGKKISSIIIGLLRKGVLVCSMDLFFVGNLEN